MSRINWIDIARGIGIILVLQGHALSAHTYRHFIYAFHMPLFFFLSGLLFNYKKDNFITVLKKSIRGILVPYIIFAFVTYGIWWIENANLRFELSAFLNHMGGIVFANSNSLFFNIVLWFLPVLLISKILFVFSTRITQNTILLSILLICFGITGYLFSIYLPGIKLPFGLESVLTAVVFFGVGSIVRTHYEKIYEYHKKLNLLIIFFASLVISMIPAQINFNTYGEQIDIRLNHLGNFFMFYIGAFAGIVAVISISKVISKNKMLETVGGASLALFVFHPIVFNYFNEFFAFIIKSNLWRAKDEYLSYVYTVLGIVIILFILNIYRRIKLLKIF